MAATFLCFTLWLRIDELVQLTMASVTLDELNEEFATFHSIHLKNRKYRRDSDRQTYALHFLEDEYYACAHTHLKRWVSKYRSMLGRDFSPSDPLFPRADENIPKINFGEKMIQNTFIKTVNIMVARCNIVPKKS